MISPTLGILLDQSVDYRKGPKIKSTMLLEVGGRCLTSGEGDRWVIKGKKREAPLAIGCEGGKKLKGEI